VEDVSASDYRTCFILKCRFRAVWRIAPGLRRYTGDNGCGWFSDRVSLLPLLVFGCLTASFSRTSWRASIFGPFLCSPERKTTGCVYFQLQENASWERSFIVAI
jgi:hypothetical protein